MGIASLIIIKADKDWRGVGRPQGLLENSEAFAKLTTANGGKFTSCSARLSSQSRYSTLNQ